MKAKKILITSELVKKTNCNTKITEIENKIHSIAALVNTAALTRKYLIENKILDTSSFIKKTDHSTKIKEVKSKISESGKYITTIEFNKFCSDIFDAKKKQANLIKKSALNTKAEDIEKIKLDKANFLTKNRGYFIIKDVDSKQNYKKITELFSALSNY